MNTSNMVRVSCGGEVVTVEHTKAFEVADGLFARYGVVPEMVAVTDDANAREEALADIAAKLADIESEVLAMPDLDNEPATERAPSSLPPPVFSSFGGELHVDDTAKARIEAQHAALISGGVKVDASQQFFDTGTRMAEVGYQTQTARKADHDAKMALVDAAHALSETIQNEHRQDIEMSAQDFAGLLDVDGSDVYVRGKRVTEQAFRGLVSRIEAPIMGYGLVLRERRTFADACRLAEIIAHECKRNPNAKLKLRTRNSTNNDVFAIVSPSFTPCDAPEVVGQLLAGMPSDAKGSWEYDATSTSWELRAAIWTPTPVAEQCVGEAFEGYVTLSARDNGTSKFRGSGGVTMIRCLNASTYTAENTKASKVHRGDIVLDVREVISEGLKAIDTLCAAWGRAREETVLAPETVPLSEAIPGFWRAMLTERQGELVGVLPGRIEHNVSDLTSAYYNERRNPGNVTRADLAQGWTKHIQGLDTPTRRDAEQAIGSWLVSNSEVGWVEARA